MMDSNRLDASQVYHSKLPKIIQYPFEIPINLISSSASAMDLTFKLTQIPSVTSEISIASFLKRELKERLGIQSQEYLVSEGRVNLFATVGKTPEIVFTTHMDTVPFGKAPKQPVWSNGKEQLNARGACDAKGIIAAQILAVEKLLQLGQTNFGFLFVADEEVTHTGAQKARVDLDNLGVKYLINGEPTEAKVAFGHYGGYKAIARAEGISGHSGSPDNAVDAGQRLSALLAHFYLARSNGSLGSSLLLGNTHANIFEITVNSADNVVPDFATAKLFIRPTTDIQELEKRIADLSKQVLQDQTINDMQYKTSEVQTNLSKLMLDVTARNDYPHYSPWESRLRINIEGLDSITVPFGTDLPFLDSIASEGSLLSGPGSIAVAHKDEEHITRQQIEDGIRTYLKIVQNLRSA
jgi:acetylornithine deacetylase